ncbi:arginine/serine-rich protein PNISR isoform X1 [Bactrocera neohumeralis]|uniref:arginine/serine-rich protein PNISR isoform X1 n=1 Tax=Bactrocera neohumeralis TaxID=98809 RepID=UPI0021668044|nr:arginine/serine-rich protein PNISR isoform X1 [Bactrocera neohumeralis]
MYSAGDSSGDGLSGLNQFAGMSGSIDWAAMAQQWIQMHDTSNFISMPDAPPPPNISNTPNEVKMTASTTTSAIKKSFDEKGEADMDMDEDEESARCGDTPPSPTPSTQLGKNRDHPVMQPQSPWFMQQPNIVVGPPVAENIPGIGNNTTPIISSAPQWNATVWPPRINLPPPVPPTMLNVPLNSPMSNPTAHIPSLLKMNVPNPNIVRMISANTGEQNPTQSVVDAKKRKMLPAWIREGLEKMEREKQKQLEREQNKQHEDPEGIDDTKYTEFVGTTDDATHTVNMKYKQSAERENDRSGCEDDGELEDLDGVAISDDTLVLPQNPTTSNDDDGSGNSSAEYDTDNENSTEQQNYKGKRSYEDRLADLMIVVRTTLTELLLDVTNQEIANLAQEAVNAHKAKASSAQVIRKSALSSITGKLGLAAYDDSTGDESSDSEDGASADNDPNNDSEEEIKASIRAKRRAFAKITDDIEESIAASAAREEQKLKYYTSLEKQKDDDKPYKKEITVGDVERNEENSTSTATISTVSKSYDRDFGETTETKLQNSNGKRQKDRNSRKERTTRFSDNKDSKSAAAVAATYMSKVHGVNANLSGNPNGSTVFPVASTTNASSVVLATGSTSTSSIAMPPESTHIAYNVASKLVDDSSGGSVTALNKNLLNAAEAAYDKVTKGHRASSSRSSASRTERERSHRSRHYDHRDRESDRYRERGSERERKRNREHESTRDKDRGKEHRHHKNKREDHSSDEDDGKEESQTSSSDTDSSSTSSSTSSSSSSQQSSHYSRTSTSSKKRREHEYDRRKSRDERSHRRTRSGRSRSRSRQRSHHHSQRGSSYRHSSAEDDNDRRTRHSSSRHGSSRKHSRSRSRSTYSSSSHWRRH